MVFAVSSTSTIIVFPVYITHTIITLIKGEKICIVFLICLPILPPRLLLSYSFFGVSVERKLHQGLCLHGNAELYLLLPETIMWLTGDVLLCFISFFSFYLPIITEVMA